MRHISRAALHLAERRIAAIASSMAVREGTAMVQGISHSLSLAARSPQVSWVWWKPIIMRSNAAPQVVAYQSSH